jgi:hypothetical protein
LPIAAALALLLISAALVYAQVGGGYDLSWSTVDGGGLTTSTGGIYGVAGTMGQPDAATSTGGIYVITGGFWGASVPLLAGHVTWQGPAAQPNARQQLPITLTLKLGTTELNYANLTTDASGNVTVSVGTLGPGTYNWRAKGPRYLANSGTVVITSATLTRQEMNLMRAGDADNNNLVSAVDFNILRAAFGTPNDLRADFNNDGLISSVDFNLLRGNFGIGGAPPIGPGG